MATTALLLPPLCFREEDSNGQPLAFGTVQSFQAGTVTPVATYTDSTGATPNANPLTLNNRGEASIWVLPNVNYKFLVKDSAGNQVRVVDNVQNSQLITLYGGVDIGIVNAYVLSFTASFSSYVDGTVIYWIPANTNTLASTINVNGLGVVNIINANGSNLSAGQIQANVPTTIIYKGGSFILVSPPPGIPTRVYKTASTSRASTTTLTADPHLIIAGGTGTFSVEALLLFNETTTGVGGIQIGFYDTGGASLVSNPQMLIQGTVNAAAFLAKANWNIAAATASISAATVSVVGTNDAIMFRGVLVGNGNGNVGISWAQLASNVNATNMLQGSWLQITQMS